MSLDNRLETLPVCGAWIRRGWAWVAMALANKQLASPNWAAVSDWSLRVM